MDAFKPHSGAKFEGYYTRVVLPSGASLIFIICTIPEAPKKAYMVCLTHVTANGKIWQQEEWPKEMVFHDAANGGGFHMIGELPGAEFSLNAGPEQSTVIHKTSEAHLALQMTKRTPWSSRTNTPESWLSYLPLPLHWHVYSLSSQCKVQLKLPPEAEVDPRDMDCTGTAHQEKNWASSFPSAHIWIQAREGGRGLCLAGGKILGMNAFLVGYRNADLGLEIDFRPPFALRALGIGPFMSFDVDWANRTVKMTVQDLTRKLVLKASAPADTFYPLSSPYATGHKENWLAQTLKATLEVEVWKSSSIIGQWALVCKDTLKNGGLEFGGEYYPLRGTEKKAQ